MIDKSNVMDAFQAIKQYASKRTDINEHLAWMFVEGLTTQPRLIVELGVRGGESTFCFEQLAQLFGAFLLSVDIAPIDFTLSYSKWQFVQSNDVEFARHFPEWCYKNHITPSIDLLFIDTSHLYEHTVEEVAAWFPYLTQGSKAFFHDTNMSRFYRRSDGSFGRAWDNKRGVIAAIENFLKIPLDEKVDFVEYVDGWIVKHRSKCLGFTILEKVSA